MDQNEGKDEPVHALDYASLPCCHVSCENRFAFRRALGYACRVPSRAIPRHARFRSGPTIRSISTPGGR